MNRRIVSAEERAEWARLLMADTQRRSAFLNLLAPRKPPTRMERLQWRFAALRRRLGLWIAGMREEDL